MFREIRKKRNKIEDSAAEELLQNSRRGVLIYVLCVVLGEPIT